MDFKQFMNTVSNEVEHRKKCDVDRCDEIYSSIKRDRRFSHITILKLPNTWTFSIVVKNMTISVSTFDVKLEIILLDSNNSIYDQYYVNNIDELYDEIERVIKN